MSLIPTKHIDGDVTVGRNAYIGGKASVRGSMNVDHNLKVKGWLEARNIKGVNKGLFSSYDSLVKHYPHPENGWWAIIGNTLPGPVYRAEDGKWIATGELGGEPTVEYTFANERMDEIEEQHGAIEEKIDTLGNSIDSLRTDLNSETSAREDGDNDLRSDLGAEASVRANDDNEQRAAIALLQRALDESEDGTFAQGVNEDLREIHGSLSNLSDDQSKTQQEVDRLIAQLESLVYENFSEDIENFREILAFLDGVKDNERLAALLDNIRSQLATADTKLSNIFSTIGQLKILTFANPEEFAARDAELIPEAGIFRIDYTDTIVDASKGEATDTPTTSRESEYIICVSGNKIALNYETNDHGDPKELVAYEQEFLQVRLSLDDISYRKVFYRYNTHLIGAPVGSPMGSPYIYQPTDWISLRGSKLESDLTWLDPVRTLHSTDLLPLQPGTNEKAGSATLDQLKTFVTADLTDFKNYAPFDNTTALRPGVYVHRGLAPGGSIETEIISYEDSGRQTLQGGGYRERWTRSYYCVRLSSSGLEYRTGTATMTIPMPEPAEIEWDDWTSLEKALSSKADVEELSNVYGVPTSVDSDGKFEALTGFTREDMKKDLFDDLFRAAVGTYGKVDHSHVDEDGKSTPYLCNGIWLTYEEAITVFNEYLSSQSGATCPNGRTNIPIVNTTNWNLKGMSFAGRWLNNKNIEVINLGGYWLTNDCIWMAAYCTKLREITGILDLRNITSQNALSNLLIGATSLVTVRLRKIVVGEMNLSDSPLISLESLRFLVDDRSDTAVLIVFVHPDVYAKLTDETNTEWHQVLLDAVEKNIQFATV